jgi:hypothetical protein
MVEIRAFVVKSRAAHAPLRTLVLPVQVLVCTRTEVKSTETEVEATYIPIPYFPHAIWSTRD